MLDAPRQSAAVNAHFNLRVRTSAAPRKYAAKRKRPLTAAVVRLR